MRETFATCGACGKHREIAAHREDGRALCRPCAETPGLTHPCPDCSDEIPGPGSARCQTCAAKRRVEAAIDRHCGLIYKPWARTLFRQACAAADLAARTRYPLPRVARIAEHVRELETAFNSPEEITREALLSTFGAEGLRRRQTLVGHLWVAGGVAVSTDFLKDAAEGRRIDAILHEADVSGHGVLVTDYLKSLPTQLAPRTRRGYIRAALGLLETLGDRSVQEMDDARIAVFLRKSPGQRASVTRFITYLRARFGVQAATPRPAPRRTQRALDRRLIRKAEMLRDALRTGGSRVERRAWLAAFLAEAFGLSLEEVLDLRGAAFARRGDRLQFETSRGGLLLPAEIAALCQELLQLEGDGPAFPGRPAARGMHPTSVKYHVDKLGIRSWRRARRRNERAEPYRMTFGAPVAP